MEKILPVLAPLLLCMSTVDAWGGYQPPGRMAMNPRSAVDKIKLEQEELERRIRGITAIASDVDGTLLSADHTLCETTQNVLRRAVAEAKKPDGRIRHFFPATGKSRAGALHSLGPEMADLLATVPGVFIQGLYCLDADGAVVFEKKLPPRAIAASERLATKFNVTLIGNFEDVVYCNAAGDPKLLGDVHRLWGEPVPIRLDSLANQEFHKLVFISDNVDMLRDAMRPELEVLANENGGTVTSSLPTVLEILPDGCSKGLGVQKLCQKLGVDPNCQLLALGDAENDKGMLEMAAIGVAMGNGSPIAKAAADIELLETSTQGGAGLAMERYSMLGTKDL